MKVLIVGGGIGGLAAAIALKQRGCSVTVYERAPEIREVGAGISLWANAVKVLRTLGVWERLAPSTTTMTRGVLTNWRGRPLAISDLAKLEQRTGAPTVGTHRADLQAALADTLGRDAILLGRHGIAADEEQSGVSLRLADGGESHGDALIAADGLRSEIRRQLLNDDPPRYAGYIAWRGIGDFACPEIPEGHTFLAMGRGSQIGMLPIGRNRTYWFATENMPPGQGMPGEGPHKYLLRKFGDWYRPIPLAIEATPETAILRNDIFDRPPVRRWGQGRITLLGDAAHPTTPNLGQGACQALEDAVVLAHRLTDPAGTIAERLRAYEADRFDRTAKVTRQSWQLGKILAVQGRTACWLRDRAFGLLGGLTIRETEKLVRYEVPDQPVCIDRAVGSKL